MYVCTFSIRPNLTGTRMRFTISNKLFPSIWVVKNGIGVVVKDRLDKDLRLYSTIRVSSLI